MKDKINKTNHKRWYYTARRMSVLSLLFFSGVATFAIPTYISLKNSEIERLKAQEEEETTEDSGNDSSSSGYLSYSD